MKTISYLKLSSTHPLKKIKNVREYTKAIKFYEELIDNFKETDELNEYLDILAMLIDDYENEKYPVEDADPVEIMKFLKRGLTLKYIYKMADIFNVKPQIFV